MNTQTPDFFEYDYKSERVYAYVNNLVQSTFGIRQSVIIDQTRAIQYDNEPDCSPLESIEFMGDSDIHWPAPLESTTRMHYERYKTSTTYFAAERDMLISVLRRNFSLLKTPSSEEESVFVTHGNKSDEESGFERIQVLLRGDLIRLNRIIHEQYYNANVIRSINRYLLKRYINHLKDGDVYFIYANDPRFEELSKFYSEHGEEVRDWIIPTVLKDSPFDIDMSSVEMVNSSSVVNSNKWNKIEEYISRSRIDEYTPFRLAHLVIKEYFENEYLSVRGCHNGSIDDFSKILDVYLFNKKLEIRPSGLVIIGPNDEEIDLNYLSSGEKKILLLIFTAVFARNIVVFMDEPEVSISILWQSILLPQLLRETSLSKIIVASHSPFLVEDESMMQYLQALDPKSKGSTPP